MMMTHPTNSSNNPLYDKMCAQFQFSGNVAVAEIMLKKAERLHVHKTHKIKAQSEKKEWNFNFTPSFVRHASICCSILILVSVLMLCAIFGTSSNSEFSKATGVFANAQNADVIPAEESKVNLAIYSADGVDIAVKTSSAQDALPANAKK